MLTPDEKTEIVNVRREDKLLPQTPEEIAKRQKLNDAAAQRQRKCRQRKRIMLTPDEKTEIVNVRREHKLLPQTPEEIAKHQKLNDAAAAKKREYRQRKRVMLTPDEKTKIVNVRREDKLLPQTPEEIAKRQKLNDAAAQRQRKCRQRKRVMLTPDEKTEIANVRREDKLLPQTPEAIAKRQKLNDAAAQRKRKQRQTESFNDGSPPLQVFSSSRPPSLLQDSVELKDALSKDELSTYRKDPVVAQNLFWETSGLARFEYGDTQVRDKMSLLHEIAACRVNDEDVINCIDAYKNEMDFNKMTIVHCACCGVMLISTTVETFFQLDDLICLRLSADEMENWLSKPMEMELRPDQAPFLVCNSRLVMHGSYTCSASLAIVALLLLLLCCCCCCVVH